MKTGEQAASDASAEVSDAIGSFLNPVLLSLGGVSVLVGAFIIFNAFSMTVTQRRREFAMLRALGASRRQVLLSITGEALVMGVLASVAGLVVGLGFAAGVNALMKALNVDIPISGLVMQPRTVIVGLVVGISITLLSALVPALRATRVPPVAALQEGASLPPSRYARFTPYVAAAVAVLGAAGVVNGMYGVGSTTQRLLAMAAGAVLLFLAVAMLAKYFVAPVAGFIGWPLMRFAKTSGRLARDNSMRNPARTAATASALMIGLGVVVFVAVFAQGLKSSFIDSFDEVVRADYVVAGKNYLTIPSDTVTRLQGLPAVDAAAGIDAQAVQVEGKADTTVPLYAVDPCDLRQSLVVRLDRRGGRGPRSARHRRGHRRGTDGRNARPQGRQEVHDAHRRGGERQARGAGHLSRPDDDQRRHRQQDGLRRALLALAALHGDGRDGRRARTRPRPR